MNKTKKVLCTVLVCAAAFLLTACGSEKSNVEKVVNSYMDAVLKYDFKTALGYTEEDPAAMPFEDKDGFIAYLRTRLVGDDVFEGAEDDFNALIEKMYDKMFGSASYSIKSVTVNGNDATATLDITMPDIEGLNFNSLIENSDFDFEGYLQELFDNGELKSEYDIAKAILPKLTELTDEALAKAEPVTKEYDIDLIKNAGKWLITKESNTLFGLLGEER